FPKLRLDILAGERDLVQLHLAAITEPRQSVELVRPALALDHEAPRRRRPDRTVRRPRATKEHFPLAHGNVTTRAVVHDLHGDVAGQLIEDLVARIDVEVIARVRAADDLEDELALGKDFLVATGGRNACALASIHCIR